MKLPGTRYCKVTGMEVKQLLIHREVTLTRFEVNDFDAFIPVRIQSPILRSVGIPETDAVQAGQNLCWYWRAWVVSFGEGVKFDLTFADCLLLRFATVHPIAFIAHPINQLRFCHSMFNNIRRTILQDLRTPNRANFKGKCGKAECVQPVEKMSKITKIARLTVCAMILFASQMVPAAASFSAVPPLDPLALKQWQSNRFGLFIHYDPVCLRGQEISWSRAGERRDRGETVKEGIPAAEYDTLYQQFDPTNFDGSEWVSIAKAAGMKYLVFTAKHHDGFAMFDSKFTAYKITATPFGRDICAELAKACHEAGIALGFYYSPPDWHHPDFLSTNHAQYVVYFHQQVRELLSNYGRVDEFWFDADGGTNTPELWGNQELFPMIRALQPQVLLTKRCGGWGDFNTPEQRIGAYDDQNPWETCMTLGTQWSWKPDDKLKTAGEVISILARTAGGDGNLLLDVGPMPDGRIEPRQVEILSQVGAWLRRNGESVYGTRGGPWKPSKSVTSTRKGNTIYVHILPGNHESIELPDIPRHVRSASLLNGRKAKVAQRKGSLAISVPAGSSDQMDTIVKLQLDGSAMDLAPLEIPPDK